MPESVNEKIQDSLIEHEVALRRVVGGAQKTAARTHIALEKQIRALLIEMDPRTDAEVELFMKRVRALATESFRSQNTSSKATLRGVARAENDAVNGAIEKALGAD